MSEFKASRFNSIKPVDPKYIDIYKARPVGAPFTSKLISAAITSPIELVMLKLLGIAENSINLPLALPSFTLNLKVIAVLSALTPSPALPPVFTMLEIIVLNCPEPLPALS
jgi:hypothetical protein